MKNLRSGPGLFAHWTLSAIVLFGLLLAVQPAKADTFYFGDVTDPLTVIRTGSADTSVTSSCIGETCTLTAFEPTGVVASIIGVSGSPPYYIADTGGLTVSDKITFTPIFSTVDGYTITFTSFDSGGVTCASVGGCVLTENGATQLGLTVSFLNASFVALASDTINFASTADTPSSVPEPSSLPLCGTALVGAAVALKRKLIS